MSPARAPQFHRPTVSLDQALEEGYGSKIPFLIVQDVLITPKDAQWLLDNKRKPRERPYTSRWKDYTTAMEREHFYSLMVLVHFDTDGMLDNGSNRLRAVVASGRPQIFNFQFNVPPPASERHDIGQNRTLANELHRLGYPNANALERVALWAYNVQEKGNRGPGQKIRPDIEELKDFMRRNGTTLEDPEPGILNQAVTAAAEFANGPKRTLVSAQVAGMFYWVIMSEADTDIAMRPPSLSSFLSGLRTGENISGPLLTLRNKLIDLHDNSDISSSKKAHYQLILLINTWMMINLGYPKSLPREPGKGERPLLPIPRMKALLGEG